MYRIVLIFTIILFLMGGIVVGFFNAQTVEFNFLFGRAQQPLIVLVAEVFGFAVLLTLLLTSLRLMLMRNELRKLRKQLSDAESELKNLRNLPYA